MLVLVGKGEVEQEWITIIKDGWCTRGVETEGGIERRETRTLWACFALSLITVMESR